MALSSWMVLSTLLATVGYAIRKKARSSAAGANDRIACPVMAALTNAGHLRPDSLGRVPGQDVKAALRATGGSSPVSGFQTIGIVAYDDNDTHQYTRLQEPFSDWQITDPFYLNLYSMNTGDLCGGSLKQTSGGYPCNINVQFMQHGYSTMIRDPAGGGSVEQRFAEVFEQKGVLEKISGVSGKVMTVAGLGKLLGRARVSGDHSGEFSLNASGGLAGSNLAYYNPNVHKSSDMAVLEQWQAIFAWSAFMQAFGKESNGVLYIPERDLKTFFFYGKFPSDWERKSWGWESVLNFVPKLKGTGAGDEFVAKVEEMVAETWCLPLVCELEFFTKVGKLIKGAKKDGGRGNPMPQK